MFVRVQILSLSEETYEDLSDSKKRFGLDFDDAYQFMIAKEYTLAIVTQDKDFKTVSEKIDVIFL